MPPARRRSASRSAAIDPQARTAFHEAGHAVLSAAINDKPDHVSIRGEHGTLGRSSQKMFARPTSLAQVYLAGFAAEHIATGRRPKQYDIETGLGILAVTDPALTEAFEGVPTSDGFGAVEQVLRTGVRAVEGELRGEVDRLYELARKSLSAVWPAVTSVAEALLVHEEIDRDGIERAIGDKDIYTPVIAIQCAHGSCSQCSSLRLRSKTMARSWRRRCSRPRIARKASLAKPRPQQRGRTIAGLPGCSRR
jgi:ATP-dependent Zn protease